MTKNLQAPCKACPFSKAAIPGALGGSSPETFIGQAFGPFMLPCHQACDFNDPEWKSKVGSTPQCAGAAAFRAAVGVAPLLPDSLHHLPARGDVFQSAVHFLAHHKQTSLHEAMAQLRVRGPLELLKDQLNRSTNRRV